MTENLVVFLYFLIIENMKSRLLIGLGKERLVGASVESGRYVIRNISRSAGSGLVTMPD